MRLFKKNKITSRRFDGGPSHEENFEGPLEKRGCTDCLCLLIFGAFLAGMIALFILAALQGDPYRVTQGYDIQGNVCGKKNVRLDGIPLSGQNLRDSPFLHFNLVRHAQILGEDALDQALGGYGTSLSDESNRNHSEKVMFCYSGVKDGSSTASTSTTTTTTTTTKTTTSNSSSGGGTGALRKVPSVDAIKPLSSAFPKAHARVEFESRSAAVPIANEDIVTLSQKGQRTDESTIRLLKLKYDAIEIGHLEQEHQSMTALLTGEGDIQVFRIAKLESQDANSNQTFQTSQIYESHGQETVKSLLSLDPLTTSLTAGGSCRYCVKNCPENYKAYFSRCIPVFAEDQAEQFYSGSGMSGFIGDVIADLKISWKEILYISLIAFGLSVLVTLLFRFFAGIIVYLILVLTILALLAGTAFLWVIWYLKRDYFNDHYSGNGNSTNSTNEKGQGENELNERNVAQRLSQAHNQEEVRTFLIGAIVASVVTVIIILIILVLRKRLKLVIQLFVEAGRAIHSMPLIILQPLWTCLAVAVIIVMWIFGLILIESTGEPDEHRSTGFVTYRKSDVFKWMRLYHLFGLLWLVQFVKACQHLVIAGAIATWYFSKVKNKLGMPIWRSFWRLVRYHLGSVALGSFLVALIQFIRIIMKQIEKRVKRYGGAGKVALACIKCCQCCLLCFEKVLKYINKNAYIEVAIYGYNFCKGAKKAFQHIQSNLIRVAAINSVGNFILLLGKIAIVVATIFIGIEIMQSKSPESDGRTVTHIWAPVLLGGLIAYIIADCFISVYGMTIDTIFLCFCEDCDRNDGISKPYFMSKGLMEFVDNSRKALEAEERRKKLGKVAQKPDKKSQFDDDSQPSLTMVD